MNIYSGLLSLIDDQIDNASPLRILEVLGQEVRHCNSIVDAAAQANDFDYTDAIMAHVEQIIEELMGNAFTTCQVQLNAVSALVKRIHTEAQESGHLLTFSSSTKNGVFALGNPVVPPSCYTQMQAINAFANYAKHHDEWLMLWEELPELHRKTADIICALGANQTATDNLRIGARSLGLTDFNPAPLGNYVTKWMTAVRQTYEAELKSFKLI